MSSTQENLIFRITVEQTGSKPAELDALAKSIAALGVAAKGLQGLGTGGGFQSWLNSVNSGVKTLDSSINGLTSKIDKLGSGGSAGLKQLDASIKQTSASLLSGGRAADSYVASQQKISATGATLMNSLKATTASVTQFGMVLNTAASHAAAYVGGAERIIGINTRMASANMRAADTLSMQGRAADSAAASLQRVGQAAQQSSTGLNTLSAANMRANTTQQTSVGLDEQRTQAIMHQARQISGLAMGFGVLTMSMDSVVGIGGMLEMQQEKVAMMQERVNKALVEHGEGSHQYEQASQALQKALRGEEYIAREATFAYHNMLFMLSSIAIMMFNDLLPSLIKVSGKFKELGASIKSVVAPATSALMDLGSGFSGLGNIALSNTQKTSNALKGLSTISKTEAKTIESALVALGTQAGMVFGQNYPMSIDTARRAQTNFTFESKEQATKFAAIMKEYEMVTRMSMAGIATETAAGIGANNAHWGRAKQGPQDFVDSTERGPFAKYKNIVGGLETDTKSVTSNMGYSFMQVADVVEDVGDVFDSNGKKVRSMGADMVDTGAKAGGLRAAISGMSLMAKTGIGIIAAAAVGLVLYGTNAMGARDAINGFGVEVGKIHPVLKAAGDALVGLAGVFGLTGESAQETLGHFEKASSGITTAWNDLVGNMQRSNDQMVSDLGDTIVNVTSSMEEMATNTETQLDNSGKAWAKLLEQLKNGDYDGAVATISESIGSIPQIWKDLNQDLMSIQNEILTGIGKWGEQIGIKVPASLGELGAHFKTEFDKAGSILSSWGANLGGLLTASLKSLGAGIAGRGVEIVEAILKGDYASKLTEWASGVWEGLNKAWHNFITGGGGDKTGQPTVPNAGAEGGGENLSDYDRNANRVVNEGRINSLVTGGHAKDKNDATRILQEQGRLLPQAFQGGGPAAPGFGGPNYITRPDGRQVYNGPSIYDMGGMGGMQPISSDGQNILGLSTDPKPPPNPRKDSPGYKSGLGVWSDALEQKPPPPTTITRNKKDLDGNEILDSEGKAETETLVTEYGNVKAAVDANRDAINQYNQMLDTSGGITKNLTGVNALYALGVTDQTLKQKEMEAAIITSSGTIDRWSAQLKNAKYNNDLLTTGFQQGQLEILGWAEDVKTTEGNLDAYDAALQGVNIHNTAFKQGVNDQRKEFQELQLGIDTTNGRFQELGKQILTQGALGQSFKKGVAEQNLAILQQAMALSESVGQHTQLSNQFATGLPQAIAYGEGIMSQVDAYQQQALGIESSMGQLMVMNTAMELGVSQSLAFKQGLVETAVAMYEEAEAVEYGEGAIKMWAAGIRNGMVGDTAFREGVNATKMQLIEQYKELNRSSGALETFGKQLKTNVPQALAYAQAVADAKMANAQLNTEFAALVGIVEMAYKSFDKAGQAVLKNNIAFLEGKAAVAEWGWELKTAESANKGTISGLRLIAQEVGVKIPEGFRGGSEELKRFISQMSGLGPIAQEVITNFDQMGDSIAKSLGEALREGNKEFKEGIKEIEKTLGFDLPDSAIKALKGSGLGQNMLSTFQEFAAIGMKAFSNMPMDDVQKMGEDLLGEFEGMYDKMDSGMQSKLAPVMERFRDIVSEGPAPGEGGLVAYLLELNATAEQIPASTSAGQKALKEISEVKFDALSTGWKELVDGFDDQKGMTSAQTKMLELAGIDLDGGKKAQWEGILEAFANDKPLTTAQQALVTATEKTTGLIITADGIKPAAEGAGTALTTMGDMGALAASTAITAIQVQMIQGLPAAVKAGVGLTKTEFDVMATNIQTTLNTALGHWVTFGTTLTSSVQSYITTLNPIWMGIPTGFQIALDQILTINVPVFFTNLSTAFMAGIATLAEPLLTLITAFQLTYETIVGEAVTGLFMTNLGAAFVTGFAMLAEPLLTLIEAFQLTFDTIIATTAVTFFATLSSMFESNIQAMTAIIQGLAVIFNDTFVTIEGNTAGYLTSIVGHHQTMAEQSAAAVQEIAVVFNDTYRTAEDNTAGYLDSIVQLNEDAVADISTAVEEIAVVFNDTFRTAEDNTTGYMNSIVQVIEDGMADAISAIEEVPPAIEEIGEAAGDAEGEVDSLKSALDSIPREITVRIRIKADKVPSIRAAQGMANSLFMASGGSAAASRTDVFTQGNSQRVIVGESGAERVIRTGLNSKRSTVEDITRMKYIQNLGKKEPEVLTVIPLEGTNAQQFKNKHPEFYADGLVMKRTKGIKDDEGYLDSEIYSDSMDRYTSTKRVYSDYISDRVAAARDAVREQQVDSVYGTIDSQRDRRSQEENQDVVSRHLIGPRNKADPGARIGHDIRAEAFSQDNSVFIAKLVDAVIKKMDSKIKITLYQQMDIKTLGKITNDQMHNDLIRS